MTRAIDVFLQNDGEVTKAYYAELNALGPAGQIAVALFRCQKRSTAAKRYRGGRFRRAAYDVKNWSLGELCRLLIAHAAALGITFGWKKDPDQPFYPWVLYIELPQGQVSFHSPDRGAGPEFRCVWDGLKASQDRILEFCDAVGLRNWPRQMPIPSSALREQPHPAL
jgi:hypothetical protein